eukprot:m.82722 g.82722  ORF g.82722 m.82722 type:complete len:429 (-) comp14631_c0_seq4:80-1366(-)
MPLQPKWQLRAMFALHLAVGNAIFYVINSLFLGPLVVFIDKPVPEGRQIAADMSFTAQAGNVVMIIYMLYPNRGIPPLSATMLAITGVAIASAVALATGWQVVADNRSLVLWVTAAIAGSLGCFGNVMSWAWAARRGNAMMSALSAGMGAGALVPSIISLVMNPGSSHQVFSVATFYWIATAMMVVALLAVLVLDYSGIFPELPDPDIDDKFENTDISSLDDCHVDPVTANTPLLASHETSHSVNTALVSTPPAASRLRLGLYMTVICLCASLIFGWQPGLVPYLMPNGHPLVVFQIAGQVADVVGRLVAPWSWLKGKELYAASLQTLLFLVMSVLAAVCDQSSNSYQAGMTALNAIFALSYGITSTLIMMSAAQFVHALYSSSKPPPPDAESRVVQTMGAALSFGSGVGGLGCYFLVQEWLAKVDGG